MNCSNSGMEIAIGLVGLLIAIATAIPTYLAYQREHPRLHLTIRVNLETIEGGSLVTIAMTNDGRADIPSSAFDAGRPISVSVFDASGRFLTVISVDPLSRFTIAGHNIDLAPSLIKRSSTLRAQFRVSAIASAAIDAPLVDVPVREIVEPAGPLPAVRSAGAATPTSIPLPFQRTDSRFAPPEPSWGSAPDHAAVLGVDSTATLTPSGHVDRARTPGSGGSRNEPIFRLGFGVVAVLAMTGIGVVLLAIGIALSADDALSFVFAGPGLILIMAAVGSLIGLVIVRAVRRLEPDEMRLTSTRRLRRPGTIVGLSLSTIGIVLFCIGIGMTKYASNASTAVAGIGMLAFVAATVSSAAVGIVRLVRVLSARGRA